MVFTTNNKEETQQLGQRLARSIQSLESPFKKALILKLEGDLGGGKTTFVQGLARGLGIFHSVLSPTFILFRRYPLDHSLYRNLYHLDCYRLENVSPKDLEQIEWSKIIEDPENIIAIEWSDRLGKLQPEGLKMVFGFKDENVRQIEIIPEGEYRQLIELLSYEQT